MTTGTPSVTPLVTTRPWQLIGAALLGLVLYLVTFGYIVSRPLTIDDIGRYMSYKVQYLASIQSRRKIAIFAGSNGRYSHRCETIAARTGIPCANLATAAGGDLRWQMSRYWPYLHEGDVLYMPLEYWPLFAPGAHVGNEAPFIVRHEHASLRIYPASRLPFALFYFDIRYLISGIGEMILDRIGIQRRVSVLTLTTQGDERDATATKAIPYRSFLTSLAAPSVTPAAYEDRDTTEALESIIDTARSRGVVVVGGLPTTFSDAIVPSSIVRRLREFYERRGACFLVLPNLSRYPRADFFDTDYHLQEAFQIAHSAELAPRLAAIARAGGCR